MLKRYLIVLIALFAFFSFPASVSADTLPVAGTDIEYDQFYHDDTDDDGNPDKKSYYFQEQLTLTAWDVNSDGSDDLWFQYSDDYLTEEISDRDFDGVPDEFVSVDRDENYSSTWPRNVRTRLYAAAAAAGALTLFGLFMDLRRKRKGKRANYHLPIILLLVFSITSLTAPAASLQAADIYNDDGSINKTVFDQDWQKYSDIDDRIPLQSRSYAAQQYDATLNQIAANQLSIFILKQQMEVDRLQRLQLREYKQALVQNIKTNLVKSLIRLSYVTYTTVDAAKGTSQSYNKLFSSSVSGIQKISSGLKVISSLQPPSSSPANIRSAGENVGKAGILEYLDTLGDPKKAGKAMFDEAVKQTQGLTGLNPDLTPEEIAILKEQHLKNRGIDKVLEDSYRLNRDRRIQVQELEQELAALQKDLARWEDEEKQRVWDDLSVDTNKDDKNDNQDDSTGDTPSDNNDNNNSYADTEIAAGEDYKTVIPEGTEMEITRDILVGTYECVNVADMTNNVGHKEEELGSVILTATENPNKNSNSMYSRCDYVSILLSDEICAITGLPKKINHPISPDYRPDGYFVNDSVDIGTIWVGDYKLITRATVSTNGTIQLRMVFENPYDVQEYWIQLRADNALSYIP